MLLVCSMLAIFVENKTINGCFLIVFFVIIFTEGLHLREDDHPWISCLCCGLPWESMGPWDVFFLLVDVSSAVVLEVRF